MRLSRIAPRPTREADSGGRNVCFQAVLMRYGCTSRRPAKCDCGMSFVPVSCSESCRRHRAHAPTSLRQRLPKVHRTVKPSSVPASLEAASQRPRHGAPGPRLPSAARAGRAARLGSACRARPDAPAPRCAVWSRKGHVPPHDCATAQHVSGLAITALRGRQNAPKSRSDWQWRLSRPAATRAGGFTSMEGKWKKT